MVGLTMSEFTKVMDKIEDRHWLVNGRCVKYVDTSFDFRTKTFWRVLIRPFGKKKEFTVANNHNPGFLFFEIMDWLEEVETDESKNPTKKTKK